MTISQKYHNRIGNPIYNTSYPLSPADWASYRAHRPLSFDKEKELSFYIHIPFCKKICSFCEYTKMICPNEADQKMYLTTLGKDISRFITEHSDIILRGFDIGGGTPTALSDDNFCFLLRIYKECLNRLSVSHDFEPSIEATFDTLTQHKAILIASGGIKRVSLGIQSTCGKVLQLNHRQNHNIESMNATLHMLKGAGIEKINLDMMYGLKGQTTQSLHHDIETLAYLNPEQVTLYELRTNMIKEEEHLSKQELFDSYSFLYDALIRLGYHARFGQNTFSRSPDDMGVSSYLRSRMMEGVAYKGFGISAQSMSSEGVAYNVGKSSGNIRALLARDSFHEEYTYRLPSQELASKYIAIGAYNGSFSLERVSELLLQDSLKHYEEAIKYCLSQDLISIDGNRLFVTKKGFLNYGAVFSLFYHA